MSGAHFVPAVCIADVMKEMCMSCKKICMIGYNLFLLFTGEERTNMTAARSALSLKLKIPFLAPALTQQTPQKNTKTKINK